MSAHEVIRSDWDSNGSWSVDVAGPWPRTELHERAARRAARGVDGMGLVQWTRLNRVSLADDGRIVYAFTVSRLSRDHYSPPPRV